MVWDPPIAILQFDRNRWICLCAIQRLNLILHYSASPAYVFRDFYIEIGLFLCNEKRGIFSYSHVYA